jgi:hypothetical protein
MGPKFSYFRAVKPNQDYMKKKNRKSLFMYRFCERGGFLFFLFCSTFVAAQMVQNINFPDIPVKGYGDTTFVLNATATSGPVTYTSSNTAVATVSGSMVTIKGVGYSFISAFEKGIGTNAAAAPVPQLLVVCPKATLTVKADDKVISFGDPIPTLTYSTTGFKNSQNASVISGIPEILPLANNLVVGTYPIVINRNTLTATNYEFMMVDGILTINSALAIPVFNSEAAEIKIFSNLGSNFISITNADKVAISVIDMSGKTVLKTIGIGDLFTVDISGLASGIYLLKAIKNNETQNMKFIVSR